MERKCTSVTVRLQSPSYSRTQVCHFLEDKDLCNITGTCTLTSTHSGCGCGFDYAQYSSSELELDPDLEYGL